MVDEYWVIGSFEIEDRPNAEIIFAGTLADCRKVSEYLIRVQELQSIQAQTMGLGLEKQEYLTRMISWLYSVSVNMEDLAWLEIHETVKVGPVI